MNCPNCNTPLLGGMTVCPRCKYNTALPDGGREHARWLMDEHERKMRREAERAGQQYGVKWLNFYINWRFPIGFVLGFMLILSYSPLGVDAPAQYPPILYLFLVLDISLYFYRVVVYINMRKRKRLGYNLNVCLLVLESIVLALQQGIDKEFPVAMFLVTLLMAFGVWFLPNYFYFKHRKDLFSDAKETRGQVRAGQPQPAEEYILIRPQNMLFCRTCGARLEPNARFCSNCGQNLEELVYRQ